MHDWMTERPPFNQHNRGVECTEVYDRPLSEQAEGYPEPHPGAGFPISSSDTDCARILMSVLRRARPFVGDGGGPDLPSQLDFILSSARRGHLPAALYEMIWELRGIFTERVISRNEVTP